MYNAIIMRIREYFNCVTGVVSGPLVEEIYWLTSQLATQPQLLLSLDIAGDPPIIAQIEIGIDS